MQKNQLLSTLLILFLCLLNATSITMIEAAESSNKIENLEVGLNNLIERLRQDNLSHQNTIQQQELQKQEQEDYLSALQIAHENHKNALHEISNTSNNADTRLLLKQINDLTKELNDLKALLNETNSNNAPTSNQRITSNLENSQALDQENIQTTENLLNNINDRLQNQLDSVNIFSNILDFVQNNINGVSAGCKDGSFNAWSEFFAGKARQKPYKTDPGYKNTNFGFILGINHKTDTDLVFGVSFSYNGNKITHKNSKQGDYTKIESYLASIYNSSYLLDNLFLNTIITAGINKANLTNTRNHIESGEEVIKSKYNKISLSVESFIGYYINISNANFSPCLGVRFMHVGDSEYNANGSYDATIYTKAYNKTELIGGAKFQTGYASIRNVILFSNFYAYVEHDLKKYSPTQKILTNVSNLMMQNKSRKNNLTKYRLGTNLHIQNKIWNFSIGYSFKYAKKHSSHEVGTYFELNF